MESLVHKYFSQYDLDAIKAAVEKAEQTTSGEFAIELASRSWDWRMERLLHALLFAGICMALALYFTREDYWGTYYDLSQTVLWGGIGFIVAYFGWGLFLKRVSRRRQKVWDRALQLFSQLTPTRGHTGVLIYISLEEGIAAIVADKGIASKVSPDYWHTPQATIVKAMSKNQHAEGIIQAIELIAVELAQHFPRESDDINELPDSPRIVD